MKVRIFLDLNETFIRTGEITYEEQLIEIDNHWKIKEMITEVSSRYQLMELILLTGNSFEYSRRIEEPLGLKNLPHLEVIILSENGLIARSFKCGELWCLDPTKDYQESVNKFFKVLPKSIFSFFYRQGNEIRQTLKPVANQFSAELLQEFQRYLSMAGLHETASVYAHPFYLDIDPKRVCFFDRELEFTGKAWAVKEFERRFPADLQFAIGDSSSDFPMYRTALENGGYAFHVSNGCELPEEISNLVCRLSSSYSTGVLEALHQVFS